MISFHCSGIWQSGSLANRQQVSETVARQSDGLKRSTIYNNLRFLRCFLTVFFIIICCFLCFPHFVFAQDSALTNFVRASAYRKADRLCYVATYYGNMPLHFDQMIHQFDLRQVYMDDVIFREGIAEWLFIESHSLQSALADLALNGGGERGNALSNTEYVNPFMNFTNQIINGLKNAFSNTKYVESLIEGSGFEDAIRRCAERKGLVFEDLLENMRSTILRIDDRSNWFGRGVQLLAFETVAAFAFRRVIWGVQRFPVHSWIFTPQVRSWLSQTRLVRMLRNRVAFFQENKAAALGVVGVPVISATTMGDISFYHRIYQENQASIENAPIQVMEEGTEEWKDRVSPIDMLWVNRWINTEERQGKYWDMIEMAREIDLDHLDNETSLPRDLAIRIDLYFVDYWFVGRRLDYLRATRGEYDSDTLELNIVKEWFDFRRRQLESQTTQDSPERAVALELLNLSRDYEFLCDFDNLDNLSEDTRPSLLCKIHFFYTMRSHNGRLSPGRAAQLQQMEAKLESL